MCIRDSLEEIDPSKVLSQTKYGEKYLHDEFDLSWITAVPDWFAPFENSDGTRLPDEASATIWLRSYATPEGKKYPGSYSINWNKVLVWLSPWLSWAARQPGGAKGGDPSIWARALMVHANWYFSFEHRVKRLSLIHI